MAKARKPCRWQGCEKQRLAGRGCSYCAEHSLAARKARRKRDRSKRKAKLRHSGREPVECHVESDPSHALALRMLTGKA